MYFFFKKLNISIAYKLLLFKLKSNICLVFFIFILCIFFERNLGGKKGGNVVPYTYMMLKFLFLEPCYLLQSNVDYENLTTEKCYVLSPSC